MHFEHPQMSTVETRNLRQLLHRIEDAQETLAKLEARTREYNERILTHRLALDTQLSDMKKNTEHMLGLDRAVNHAED